jgi:Grx4 family monothiol glutaredoxin
MALQEFGSDKELTRTLFNNFGKLLVFTFYAEWNQPSLQLRDNLAATVPLFGQFDNVKYFALAAEKCPETFKKFAVEFTPTVIFTQTDKKILRKFESEDVGLILDALTEEAENHRANFEQERKVWHPKIKSILSESAVIIFIKGTAENPKCGFTETLLKLLNDQQVEYTYYDILADEYMRYWLRNYSGWPTYPQVYAQGNIVGGLDVCKELIAKGDFLGKIPVSARAKAVEEKFNDLVKEHPLLVLTDGFSFESKAVEGFLGKVKEQYKDGDATVFNLGLDLKLKQFVKEKVGEELPILLVQGQPTKL